MTLLWFCKNYFSTLLFIFFAYIIYSHSSFYTNFINTSIHLDILNFTLYVPYIFYSIVVLYIIFLIPFYVIYPESSKARIVINYFCKVVSGDNSYSQREKTALLAWIVKLIFVPLMITWLSQHIFTTINNTQHLLENTDLISSNFLVFFNAHFFWTAFNLILFIDVLFFTLGYLIEIPKLKNTIKSVEPTLIGWAVVLLCYPPFNNYTGNFISWYSTDFPQFWNMYVHIVMNLFLLGLMGIYAWASFSLWLKASNLTNRGIIKKWPYKYIRHPAYICKNTAWLIWWIPMILVAFNNETLSLTSVLIGLWWWAFIYYMRAMTEENHLSMDPDYIEYKKQVPYKFIPKIW
jgi:protein-S-isoprenylcysteine O-methyltransferase Ste14